MTAPTVTVSAEYLQALLEVRDAADRFRIKTAGQAGDPRPPRTRPESVGLWIAGGPRLLDALRHAKTLEALGTRRVLLDQFEEAGMPTVCSGCGKEIDPGGCGAAREPGCDPMNDGHGFVPMGCDCLRPQVWEPLG